MWTKLTALLLLLAVATSVPLDEPERRCVDGKSYNDGCNWCNCMGGLTACTSMACGRYDSETGEYVPTETLPPPEDYWVA
ncbi:uncharacterized protein LOC117225814 [Megalopta genalis]|uniref:uncharacterized protein LOC117225814 n=1 Tax=Megalopta genalis TaxID=115081 RepID=UPI003FD434E6